MRTTAILNQKGGVAKTVTTVNMAAILAADHQQRVLVVDADSQANTTECFGGAHPGASTFSDMLRRIAVNEPARPANFPGISLIAADDSLMDLDLSKVEASAVDALCLRNYLQQHADAFDTVLIDCPPAFNAASTAALIAADDVIIPVKMDAFALRGMANLTRQIKNMQRINPKLRLAGLLPTMTYRGASIMASLSILQDSGLPVYPSIRRTPKVDEMTFAQDPLLISSPTSAACKDYRRLVSLYLEGGARHE